MILVYGDGRKKAMYLLIHYVQFILGINFPQIQDSTHPLNNISMGEMVGVRGVF